MTTQEEVLDPELDVVFDIVSGGDDYQEGIRLGIVWATLWSIRSEISARRVPIPGLLVGDLHPLLATIGWTVSVGVIPEGWDHEGEPGWVLGEFQRRVAD